MITADSNCNSQVLSLSFSLFPLMCQSLLRPTRHTSTSSLISFICLFHPLIFTSASFTILPLFRGALTSAVHPTGPGAMIRVRGEKGEMKELSNAEKVGRVGGGWDTMSVTWTSRSQPVTQQSTPVMRSPHVENTIIQHSHSTQEFSNGLKVN